MSSLHSLVLHMHIPANTYNEKIEKILLQLYTDTAMLTIKEIREEKLKILSIALDFLRNNYEVDDKPQRIEVLNNNTVTVENLNVSNIRIFF